MKSMLVAALFAASLGGAAQAETFTFTSNATSVAGVTVPGPNNTTRAAGVSTFTGSLIMGGKTLTNSGQCAAWPSLPGDIFQSHGQCTFSDATGAGFLRYGCNPGKTDAEANCVGGLWGTGGAYAGRSGSMAWHGKAAADGKSTTSVGAGQWGD
jgi:hypothetical protein